ncbi:translation initiation factor eIF3 subunit [Cucurbitaria berberidis CBS 394.84]|uniref:Eukaryotic translation initiation factor 3 subunit J n=1 Tax=Cucurbitaria berberidis CBS 394.84 TaxID=1168544 RepID=A0A9P4L939_9PLEO|nr:translation initiation factor eIF3 subunit [Cucurbitaria berberidis CBS 394.84]KAF1845824.1 translation initiation factor eIF3 subunit [Cucurbitaria berberidis CBS 394.84]
MAPGKWDDEDEESTPPTSPVVAPIARRSKFDDEEDDDDVLESWDAAEDSEVEREKAKKAAEAKAKADAEAKANHKSKAQRVEEHRQAALRRRQENDDMSSDEEETEAEKRARLKQQELDGSLHQAAELFGDLGVAASVAKKRAPKAVTVADAKDPGNAIDLSSLPIFNPNTKDQFTKLRETLTPLIAANSKKGQYSLFLQEFTKQIAKDLPSDQIKKIASGLTTLSNERMKEEKTADKGGKKTKAAKTKTTLNASRDVGTRADMETYDDDFGDDDFM